ncbi:hypothetical protein P152DRAFT_454413 [Eremomyces bilateralis CBS 781.70]|uniref:Uncharacterized protein n=1 Tax=Eremomyces bilateralis CBS 781.70 TaxID=1392243 RepID=A0A6G1GDJ6_9PEZI|nr:uncharacterized protein P152DRAFT_454413 [Eremomyces bilateralis CBS 781.70]KAF1816167.1 hypothetical protein P152DRAFT_454413 [Eremomyces bilateralis CBS 781.70]
MSGTSNYWQTANYLSYEKTGLPVKGTLQFLVWMRLMYWSVWMILLPHAGTAIRPTRRSARLCATIRSPSLSGEHMLVHHLDRSDLFPIR